MKRNIFLSLAIITVAVLSLTVPFLNQAFHIDDREFIEFARVQVHDPLRFYLTDYDFAGRHLDNFRTSHPPLLSSLIAFVIWETGGESEPVLHAAYLVFPLIACIAMYFLARRFCRHPLMASLLLLVTGGFLVSSHTLMGDVPGTALWLAAATTYITGVDRQSWKLLGISSLLMAVAVMTAFQCLSLIPLMFLYLVLNSRITKRNLLPLIAPIMAFGAFALFILKTSSNLPQLSYRVGLRVGWIDMPDKIRALVTFLGGASVFPLSLIVAFAGRKKAFLTTGLAVVLALAAGIWLQSRQAENSAMLILLMIPMLAAGAAVFSAALIAVSSGLTLFIRRTANVDRDALFLFLWLLGVSFYIVVFLPYVYVRHMLPMFPPLIILFLMATEELFRVRKNLHLVFLGATLGLSLLVSLPVAISDYRLANSYRDMASGFRKEFEDSGRRVWFLGEFDFRYYMEREGFPNLGEKAVAYPGDLVIRSELSSTAGNTVIVPPPPDQYSLILNRSRSEDSFPVRVRNPRAGAGFYNYISGPLPYMFSREYLDEFTIYELRW